MHPRDRADFARLRAYASVLDADVVALEEVDGPRPAALLFPGYQLDFTHDHVVQRVGFAIRRGLAYTANPDLVGLVPYPTARYPLRSGADITLDLADGLHLRLLAVHLKTGCLFDSLRHSHRRACHTLLRQIPALQGWIAARRAEGVPFIVLGDFNRRMDHPEMLQDAMEKAAPLLDATTGRASPCWGGESFIDHIFAGGPARAWMRPSSLRVLVYREHGRVWKNRLSDHCPVSVRFDLPGR